MEKFEYTPLNLEKPAIRLLSLHPGDGDKMISCELFQAELHENDNTVSYEALSYTWGSPDLCKMIHVNGCCLKITHNLYYTLRDIRYQEHQRVLWVDAVCIDQGNDKERGHQVGQMGNIYKQADRVIFRLGLGSYVRDLFMESMQRLQRESIHHACRAWSRQDSRWEDLWTCSFGPVLELHQADLWELQQGLKEILEHPWFRRVWILQEVAFSKAAIISCGTKSVSARLFGLAPLLLGVTPDAHCQSVLDIMPSPWRESTWWRESRSFYKLLLNFGKSAATDPRDLVYALRGMSSDLADKRDDALFPDYQKSDEELVRDVIHYIYDFDVRLLTETPFLSSIRELAQNLPILETNICRYFAERSQPDDVERIFNRTEMLVTKDMMKVAAQYDKEGKVVNVFLRRRWGEFDIDSEVLLCAAANLSAAKEVFEAFWYHQDQIVITEEVLIATSKNSESGLSAMCFLLSLKTQDYRIAPILETIARNAHKDSRRKIARMLQQKNYNNDTIREVLTAAAEIQDDDLQTEIIKTLLQQKSSSDITISEIMTAAANIRGYDLQTEIIEMLLQKKGSSNDIISEVITAAVSIRDSELQTKIIKTLLQQKGSDDNIISEVIIATANIKDFALQNMIMKALLQQKGNSNDIISKAITAAANIQDSDLYEIIILILATQKGSSTNIISEIITAADESQDFFLTKEEMIRILIEQKGNGNDTISKCLTFGINVLRSDHMIIRDFVRKNPGFEISRDVVIFAMKNWPNYTDSLKLLYHYFPSLNSSRKQVA